MASPCMGGEGPGRGTHWDTATRKAQPSRDGLRRLSTAASLCRRARARGMSSTGVMVPGHSRQEGQWIRSDRGSRRPPRSPCHPPPGSSLLSPPPQDARPPQSHKPPAATTPLSAHTPRALSLRGPGRRSMGAFSPHPQGMLGGPTQTPTNKDETSPASLGSGAHRDPEGDRAQWLYLLLTGDQPAATGGGVGVPPRQEPSPSLPGQHRPRHEGDRAGSTLPAHRPKPTR